MVYKAKVYDPAYCQLATTANTCPPTCNQMIGPSDTQNVQVLDPSGRCGEADVWEGGCLIKSSK